MAKSGRPRKKADQAQGHRRHLAVVDLQPSATDEEFTVPPPPLRVDGAQLAARTLLAWDAFWSAAVASSIDREPASGNWASTSATWTGSTGSRPWSPTRHW